MTAEEVEQHYLESMGLDLGRFYHRLWSECVYLHWKWSDYASLFGSKPERIDLLNSAAPAFFKLTQDMMWENILLHICRLMDPPRTAGKDNLTLQSLPRMVAGDSRPEVEELLAVAKRKCEFAIDWRNRHIAHRDLRLVLEKSAVALAGASRRNVIDALEAIASVLNAVEFRYTAATVYYDLSYSRRGDATSLLHVLREGIEAETARIERKRSGQALPADYIGRPDI